MTRSSAYTVWLIRTSSPTSPALPDELNYQCQMHKILQNYPYISQTGAFINIRATSKESPSYFFFFIWITVSHSLLCTFRKEPPTTPHPRAWQLLQNAAAVLEGEMISIAATCEFQNWLLRFLLTWLSWLCPLAKTHESTVWDPLYTTTPGPSAWLKALHLAFFSCRKTCLLYALKKINKSVLNRRSPVSLTSSKLFKSWFRHTAFKLRSEVK